MKEVREIVEELKKLDVLEIVKFKNRHIYFKDVEVGEKTLQVGRDVHPVMEEILSESSIRSLLDFENDQILGSDKYFRSRSKWEFDEIRSFLLSVSMDLSKVYLYKYYELSKKYDELTHKFIKELNNSAEKSDRLIKMLKEKL